MNISPTLLPPRPGKFFKKKEFPVQRLSVPSRLSRLVGRGEKKKHRVASRGYLAEGAGLETEEKKARGKGQHLGGPGGSGDGGDGGA